MQESEEFPDAGNCTKVMQTVGCGMYSTKDNMEICIWCCRLLSKIVEELKSASTALT